MKMKPGEYLSFLYSVQAAKLSARNLGQPRDRKAFDSNAHYVSFMTPHHDPELTRPSSIDYRGQGKLVCEAPNLMAYARHVPVCDATIPKMKGLSWNWASACKASLVAIDS